MQRDLNVRYKSEQRQPAAKYRREALEIVSGYLAKCGFFGEWQVDFQRAVRKRSEQNFAVKFRHDRITACVKPGGQDSAFECILLPPPGVP